jgi:hypothetical protein
MQHEENMKANDLRIEQMRVESKAAGDRHAAEMQANNNQFQQKIGLEERKLTAETGSRLTAQEDLKREQSLAPLAAQYGEGVRHIAAGDYATPQAQDALRKLAKQSDESWFGFGQKDAVRMEAILQRLGVNDPDARSQMIERFGYEPSNNFLGMGGDGRGERLSYWFSGRPR